MRKLIAVLALSTIAIAPFALAQSLGGGLFGPPSSIRLSTFANLSTPIAGHVRYCTDCTPTAPCAGSGTGAFAFRVGSAWNCSNGSASTGGTFLAGDGTAAAPSYSFASTGNGDNGMFLSAANALGFSTAGTERWVINASGIILPSTNNAYDIGNGLIQPRDISLTRNLAYYSAASTNFWGLTTLDTSGNLAFKATTLAPGATTGALAGLGAGNVDNGTHSYKVTFVTAGGETDPGVKSNVVTVVDKTLDGQIALTAIPTGNAFVTSRKIYRTVAGDAGAWKLLTTLANNTATTYTDNTDDATLGADAPTANANSAIDTRMTIGNNGNVGIGGAHSASAGVRLLVTDNNNNNSIIRISNSDAAGTSSAAVVSALADVSTLSFISHGSGRTTVRWGEAIGGWAEVISTGGDGLAVGTTISAPLKLGTASRTREYYSGSDKTLTESTETAVTDVAIASNTICGGTWYYTIRANDASAYQALRGSVSFSAVNEAGTETCVIGTPSEVEASPTGTLTNTVTCTTAGTNTVTLNLNAVSSLAQTTLNTAWSIRLDGGTCSPAAAP